MPRVAVLVETSTTWGRNILAGIIHYTRTHQRWQIFVEARGMEENLELPRGWRGDGVIARITSPAMAAHLRSRRIPIVNVSGIQVPGAGFPRVCTDLEGLARLAADYFLGRGFRHFAYFGMQGVSYVNIAQQSFKNAIKAAGCDFASFEARTQAGAEPDWRLDLVKLGHWLKSLPCPLAVLCWNSSGAREIIFACQEVGLLVPEQVAVLCQTDDDMLCEASHIPISGLRVAADTAGYQAAKLLDSLMRGARPPRKSQLIPPMSVVTRQSTDILAVSDPVVLKALKFIRQQSSFPMQVGDVARHAGVSRRALEYKFIEVLRRTPAEELRQAQFERVRMLLAETNLPMTEVAEKSGFCSQAYMAAVFRKHFNQTPMQFRKESYQMKRQGG